MSHILAQPEILTLEDNLTIELNANLAEYALCDWDTQEARCVELKARQHAIMAVLYPLDA